MKKKSVGDMILDIIIYIILITITLFTLYPLWYVFAASFTTSTELVSHAGILLWPKNFDPGAYEKVFENRLILSGFLNSVKLLLLSLPLCIVMTTLCGYFLACTKMMLKKPISFMILFTMFFGGGLVPTYLNIRSLGLYDSVWALVLPVMLSVYNAIICKTAIEAIPVSLTESAYIDGANDFQVLLKIILPLIKPTLAVLLLYYGVGQWNSWFPASIYIRDDFKMPIQNILRDILMANESRDAQGGDVYNAYAESIKYAAIVVATIPILCIYPFLQKYFVKGAMIGAVKG